ncbi:hypothetical protein [Pseudoxanthomonas mexicana]|uniref:hypothetical protein n=1 Tax=Pseudoxanthomonas mexicana TaxID=128785 RepID=UPI0028ADB0A8|nr:hypothetical protein [Pseudoxanthomonas mexicana]
MLDAIFFESYTRWSGTSTLLIPVHAGDISNSGFKKWLNRFDPDFLYTYSTLLGRQVEEIDHVCSPIAFLEHKQQGADVESGWRGFLPRWEHYFRPISSISTVRSPEVRHLSRQDRRSSELTIFTQYHSSPTSRLLADNFGVSVDIHNVMHEVPGFYRTLCLTPESVPANIVVGSERCQSVLEAFAAI